MTPNRHAPYVERLSLSILLPRYFLIRQVALIAGFGLLIVGVLGLTHRTTLSGNPFAVYTDVLPGQPLDALDAHGFDCDMRNYDYYADGTETRCNLSPETGAFSHIEAVSTRGVIHVVNFEIRETALNIGEIAAWLDISEIRSRGNVQFNWQGKVGMARRIYPYRPFSKLRRVWLIMLTDTRYEK